MSNPYRTENPATGEVEATFPDLDESGIDAAIGRAHEAFARWRTTDLTERSAILHRVADAYDERADELAAVVGTEMGKPQAQALGELKLVSMIYRWYADQGPALLADEELEPQGAASSVVRTEPVGVLLGVMPWNFPHYQVARFVAPNLMAGNTVLLKHAEICARSAELIEELLHDAGVPGGAYVNLFAPVPLVERIIADPRVQGVSLTGSERAGAAVAATAGQHLKKSVLELGGSDPMIVLGDVDVPRTAKSAARARMGNCGQACNSPKRMFVVDDVYDEFLQTLVATVEGSAVGDPAAEDTAVGPMSSASARDGLAEQVDDARAKGATVHTGGAVLDRPGAFYAPTVLSDLTEDMRAWTEELFGPVAMVYRVKDADEAVALANASDFGLSGSVWSADDDRAAEVADRLEVGMAYVNEHGTTLPGLPFGGVKRSGYGRELAGYGLGEFVNRKLVRVAKRRS